MKIDTNSVFVRYTEIFELLRNQDKDLFFEVLETLTEVVEVAVDTSPSIGNKATEIGINLEEEGVEFGFAFADS